MDESNEILAEEWIDYERRVFEMHEQSSKEIILQSAEFKENLGALCGEFRETTIRGWHDFLLVLNVLEILTETINRCHLIKEGNLLLFRGQSQEGLTTTLDRVIGSEKMSLSDYYRIILKVKTRIETETDRMWIIPSCDDYKKRAVNHDLLFLDWLIKDQNICSYMTYLRHHGFPSPLLDWTASPYVAAFFALSDIKEKADDVFIYVYLDRAQNARASGSKAPFITIIGNNFKSHKRHFLQQSNYTCCIEVKDNGGSLYASHEAVFAGKNLQQDLIWKLKIPVALKDEFLKKLTQMNITAFSLFGSEDSLMSTLAFQEFHSWLNR